MGSQTPIFGLPFPVGTDRVMDGDDAIRALAEKIEAVQNTVTVWTALPVTNGWVGTDLMGSWYTKRWGIVYGGGVCTKVTWAADEQCFVMPPGHRPTRTLTITASANHLIWIDPNGIGTIRSNPGGGGFYFEFSYPAAP